jgi:hypothetical protein
MKKVIDKVGEIKRQAEKLKTDATKTAGTLGKALQTGVATSKFAAQKAGTVLNKKGLGQGVEATSKGMQWAAKSARIASKSAQQIADTLEKASASLKKAGQKLKD